LIVGGGGAGAAWVFFKIRIGFTLTVKFA
jgi:hypothetical protein